VGALEVPTLLLDGEIAVFDRQLLSRFEWLRGRPSEETAISASARSGCGGMCSRSWWTTSA
jgi:hypothetical protein